MSRKLAFLISLVFLTVFAFLGWQAQKFEIDASAETLLTKDNKKFIFSEIIAKRYDPQEFILIALKSPSNEIFSEKNLNRIDRISQEIEKIARVKQVNSLVNAPIFLEANLMGGRLDQDNLSWKERKYPADYLQKNLRSHPLYEGLLVNEEQTALGMQVVFKTPKDLENINNEITSIRAHRLNRELKQSETKKLEKLMERKDKIGKELSKKRRQEINQIKNILAKHADKKDVYMGGNNLLVYQLISIIQNDLKVFGIAIVLIISILLFLFFRRLAWVLMPLACCFTAIVMTMGLLGFFELKVTVISANVISLQIILTLAIIIHMIEQFREIDREEKGKDLGEKVEQMVKEKLKPCFYAGLTTSVGFASLIFSGVQPVITFGWMMILAMIVTLSVGLVLFPAMVRLFIRKDRENRKVAWVEGLMKAFGKMSVGFPKSIVFFSLLLTGLGVYGCFFLTAENSFINYFSDQTEVHRELSFIDKDFGGSTALDILYNVPKQKQEKQLILTAEAVQHVGKIHRHLAEKKEIGSVTSLYDFTTVARVVREKPMTEYELTFFVKMMDEDLKESLLGSYFSEKHNQVRISTRVKDSTENFDREKFINNLKQEFRDMGYGKEEVQMTGLFVLYQDILARLLNSQINTLAIVYLVMIIVLWIIFSSLKIALLAMVPNVLTTAITLGFMGFMGIPLDLMTMTIAAVAMGISVDDTIHYVHRYLKENKKHDPDKAVLRAHSSVGHALFYTTGIIIIGFGSMVFSDFVPTIYFGLLTGMAMLIALLSDVITLPVLLKKFVNNRS